MRLLNIARRLRATLAPVAPPPAFVADLKSRLLANAQNARDVAQRQREERRRALVVAAGAGGVVYLLGLAAMGVRTGLSLLGLALIMLGWRRDKARERTMEVGAGRLEISD